MGNYIYTKAALRAGAKKGSSPKSDYISLTQHTIDEQFYNASNWWTIQEETEIGSREYREVDVRIAHVINAETGLKLGDDWKTLYFKSTEEPPMLGRIYLFDGSVWLTTNIESDKNLVATCTIRRCNNTLRWVDEKTGHFYEEPCAIEYLVKEPRDYATQGSPFKTPGGFLHIETQFNKRTNLITENQRFLFGNPNHWTGYRVIGAGINDFRNAKTYDWHEAKILTLDMITDFVNNELDDIVNGIANAGINLYAIDILEETLNGAPGDMAELHATITYNGNSVIREIEWESSDESVASVDSNGKVLFIKTGSCLVTANIKGNPTKATCNINVTAAPFSNYEIRITPDKNYVLEKSTGKFEVYLYENGIKQNNTFNITCDNNAVPPNNFVFTGGTAVNTFTIKNKLRYLESNLTITCACNGKPASREVDIYLRGAWLYGAN